MARDDQMWGLDLRTTGFIIGWTCFVVGIIQAIYIMYYIYNVPKMAKQIAGEGDMTNDRRQAIETVKAVATMTLCIYLFFVGIDLIAALLLIIGIEIELSVLLLPWLINSIITLLTRVSCSICLFIFCALSDSPNETMVFIGIHGITTIISILMWFFILELYLYFEKVKS